MNKPKLNKSDYQLINLALDILDSDYDYDQKMTKKIDALKQKLANLENNETKNR